MTITSHPRTNATENMVVRYNNDQNCLGQWSVCQIFRGRMIHSKSLEHLEILQHANIGVDQNGTITFVNTSESSDDELRVQFAANGFSNATVTVLQASQFLFPGLIDTHLHAPQWPNLALGMEGTLREWIENYTDPVEASYSDNDKARRVYADVVKTTLRLGSTTVAYNTTIHADATNILADCVLKAGQRAIVGKMCILLGSTRGNWEASTEVSLKESQRSIDYVRNIDPQGRLVRPCVQPRGGPYCPAELMKGLGEQSESSDAFVQAHMCETKSDIGASVSPVSSTSTDTFQTVHWSYTPSTGLAATCTAPTASSTLEPSSRTASISSHKTSQTSSPPALAWPTTLTATPVCVMASAACAISSMPESRSD